MNDAPTDPSNGVPADYYDTGRRATFAWSSAAVLLSVLTVVVMYRVGFNADDAGGQVDDFQRGIIGILVAFPSAMLTLVEVGGALWLSGVTSWRVRLLCVVVITLTAMLALFATLWFYKDAPDTALNRPLLALALLGPTIPIWVALAREQPQPANHARV
jgi:hypothetical protein